MGKVPADSGYSMNHKLWKNHTEVEPILETVTVHEGQHGDREIP